MKKASESNNFRFAGPVLPRHLMNLPWCSLSLPPDSLHNACKLRFLLPPVNLSQCRRDLSLAIHGSLLLYPPQPLIVL